MFDVISIGLSGLQAFSKGLRTIGSNITNLNTPGFKGQSLQFTNLFHQEGQSFQAGGSGAEFGFGMGVGTLGSAINFKQGDIAQSGNPLDAAVDGDGYFILRDDTGTRYTRNGGFQFDPQGVLVSRANGERVQGYGEDGALRDITLDNLRSNPPKATTSVDFTGNLSSSATTFTISDVAVISATGGNMTLKLTFKSKGVTSPGAWTVTANDGTSDVGSGDIVFANGLPKPDGSTVNLTFAPAGSDPFSVAFNFGTNVTSFDSGSSSTLAVSKQDGYATGELTGLGFDAQGVLNAQYSNGQTAKVGQLALARFESNYGVSDAGNGAFMASDDAIMRVGVASNGGFGSVTPSAIEGSNVDISSEFSELIVMQRGFQASSRVVSTADQMLQELFDLKSNR